jgi:transcriptional regulator with XRE-family HTH domain
MEKLAAQDARNRSKSAVNRANSTDRHVGAEIRRRRIMLGLSQQELADLIGVTYQQAHKYERGINRISASRLYDIANVLQVSVGHFFDRLGDEEPTGLEPKQRMCLELARNFMNISDEEQQEALSQMARVLASSQPN